MISSQSQSLPQHCAVSHSRLRGFTLIELMIVLVVVAILAAIALPAYGGYVQRVRLTDGMNALLGMQAQMERYFQDNRTYASVGAITPPCTAGQSGTTAGAFSLSCDNPPPDGSTYTITATGSGQTAGFVFTIDQNGNRATAGLPDDWGTTPCASAWIVKKGQSCN